MFILCVGRLYLHTRNWLLFCIAFGIFVSLVAFHAAAAKCLPNIWKSIKLMSRNLANCQNRFQATANAHDIYTVLTFSLHFSTFFFSVFFSPLSHIETTPNCMTRSFFVCCNLNCARIFITTLDNCIKLQVESHLKVRLHLCCM